MKIEIILPYKEIFSEKKASAVSITVKNSMKFSKYKKNILIAFVIIMSSLVFLFLQ